MNIVFLCGGYYPNTSATGNCVKKIADMFSTKGHATYVICKSPDSVGFEDVVDNQIVHRITNKRLSDGVKLRMLSGKKQKMFTLIYKIRWAIYGLLQSDGMDASLVEVYYNELVVLSEKINVDVIVPCCMPAECLKAAYKFKTRYDCLMFPLLYDLYSDNVNFFRFAWSHKLRKKTAERLEKNIFSLSSMIFYVDNWKQYFKERYYENAVRVEHPLVVNRTTNPIGLSGNAEINAIYQGEVNYQMRPPKAMVNAFKYLSKRDGNISLHVCSYGNAVHEIEAASKEFPSNIFFYGVVNKDVADGYYDASEIAVILANKEKDIVPSKVFECVASGYPIIYFFYDEDEQAYKLLSKYPHVYFICQADDTEEHYEKLYDWILKNKDVRVSFDEVRSMYRDATPDFVYDTICSSVKELTI